MRMNTFPEQLSQLSFNPFENDLASTIDKYGKRPVRRSQLRCAKRPRGHSFNEAEVWRETFCGML